MFTGWALALVIGFMLGLYRRELGIVGPWQFSLFGFAAGTLLTIACELLGLP